ncbi:MAG: ATP-grasp domain-containing protein [Planctomycetaceae bacterium]
MRVFISEFLTCGAWTGPPQPSLIREGRAMLRAAAIDFARVAGCRVVTTWDARLEPPDLPGVEVRRTEGAADEARLFRRLARECDATLVIAPETGGMLAARRRMLDDLGARSLGPTVEAIELTADKLRLARHLAKCGIPTIPTEALSDEWRVTSDEFRVENARDQFSSLVTRHSSLSVVVKPRDGAGSLNTFIVSGLEELDRVRREFFRDGGDSPGIVQPFVAGRAVSMAAIVGSAGKKIDLLPIVEQRVGRKGTGPFDAGRLSTREIPEMRQLDQSPFRVEYLGGRVPAEGVDAEAVRRLVRAALAAVPGLCGYVGCDVLVPADAPHAPLVVEINPRLTTSYLGYRELAEENLAGRMWSADEEQPPIRWRGVVVAFDADGTLRLEADRAKPQA